MRYLATTAAVLLLGVGATAQIDVNEYVQLGSFDTWRAERTDASSATTTLRVKKVQSVDGVIRYTLSIPVLDGLESVSLTLGSDEGVLNMYGVRFNTPEMSPLSGKTLTFDPPVELGNAATVLDDAPVSSAIDETVTAFVTVENEGMYYSSLKMLELAVGGTIDTSWQSVLADAVTPAGTFPAADLARMVIDFNLTLTSTDEYVPFDAVFAHPISAVTARNAGFVQLVGKNGNAFDLEKAIVPGQLVGDFPPLPDAGFIGVTAPSEGLFTLHEASDAASTGGDFALTDVRLEHRLNGQLMLYGEAAPLGSLEPPVPFTLKGKARLRKLGDSRVTLKGSVYLPELGKKLSLRVAQDVDAAGSALTILYKAGYGQTGELSLAIAPVSAASISVSLDTPVDRSLNPKTSRTLGAEGSLSIGDRVFPVTAVGRAKVKAGNPEKHSYVLAPTGLKGKLMKLRGAGVNELDFALDRFTMRLFGKKFVVPDIGVVVPDVE